ncbi:MAG: metallophosphoesterase [Thermoguttaceae bacterium]|nr:metallophosphoesterase [Thermoguttaceae bacterium]
MPIEHDESWRFSRRGFGKVLGTSAITVGLSWNLLRHTPRLSAKEAAENSNSADSIPSAKSVDPNLIVWFSDTHVPADVNEEINKTCPAQNLIQAMGRVVAMNPRPAAVCFCGDTVKLEGKVEDYRTFRQIVSVLDTAGIPWFVAFGNHDNREAFYEVFPEKKPTTVYAPDHLITIVETPYADLILLDSLIRTNYTPGEFGKEQIQWIKNELARRKEGKEAKSVYFAAHHPLVPGKSEEHSGLWDTDFFLNVVVDDPEVKGYIFGHSHTWERYKTFAGMTLPIPGIMDAFVPKHLTSVNLPALGWLFADQPRGWTEMRIAEDGTATFTLKTLDPTDKRDGSVYRLP